MAINDSAVKLPPDLVDMFHLAREAFLYYETETKAWDENSLVMFRDAMFDLVKASEATSPELQERYIGTAMEHLALVVSEPLQGRTEEILAEIAPTLRRFNASRLIYKYDDDLTDAKVNDVKKRIDYHLKEGRKAKASITLDNASKAFESFLAAYEAAFTLRGSLRARKFRLSVKLLL